MQISLVAAMARNRVIGQDNQMPWHLPEELKYFKQLTMGKPIIMGRRTFESIGRPLPGRHNIVLTSSSSMPEGVTTARSMSEALAAARANALTAAGEANEVMIIGGGEIYRQFLPQATRLYLTHIDLDVDGDTRFPCYNELTQGWQQTELRRHAGDANTPAFVAILLQKA